MAFDPSSGRFYWGNYGVGAERENAIGTVTLSGGGGGITPVAAPVSGRQDPVVLKSPTGTGAPAVTKNGTSLSCSQGSWSQDYPGSFVYAAPQSYSYRWLLNGQPIEGATASTHAATAAGAYACAVTARNISGSGSQASGSVTVTAAALSMALQANTAKAKAGKAAKVMLQLADGGDLASASVRVCGRSTRRRRRA